MRSSCLALFAGLLVGVVFADSGAAQTEGPVRVRLFGLPKPAAVSVSGAATVSVDGRTLGRIAAGAPVVVARDGAGVRVSGPGVDGAGQTVEVAPDGGGRLHVQGGRTQADVYGRLVVQTVGSELVPVNHVPMAAYVASVVASEYGFPEIEGVKAQAVLARTYAVRARDARRAYDLDDHQGSQVYRGAGVVTATSERATRETTGLILTYRGAPAEAVYSSSSGGHTADNEAVWLTAPVPYLRGVPDPYDSSAPDHSWRTTADAARVHAALSRRYGGHVTGIFVQERSREGRAVRVRLVGAREEVVSGERFRSVVNGTFGWRTVRSTKFDVALDGAAYAFTGGGFGHGVGMSQYGARGQARAGRSFLDILGFYFQGTEVSGDAGPAFADAGAPRASAPSAPRPRPAPRSSAPSASAPSAPPVAAQPAQPAQPARAPRGRGEAVVLRNEPDPAPARPDASPTAPSAAPAADGRRWPTRRGTRGGW